MFFRHEYYQKPEEVVVTIFAKGIPANNVVVDFGEQIVSFFSPSLSCSLSDDIVEFFICANTSSSFVNVQLSVTIEVAGEEAYHFQPRLFGKVRLLPAFLLNKNSFLLNKNRSK